MTVGNALQGGEFSEARIGRRDRRSAPVAMPATSCSSFLRAVMSSRVTMDASEPQAQRKGETVFVVGDPSGTLAPS